jgi:hypothetical protein
MTDDAQVRAHVFELLGQVFALQSEYLAAAQAVILDVPMHAFFAFAMVGQQLTASAFALRPRFLRFDHLGGVFIGLQFLEP